MVARSRVVTIASLAIFALVGMRLTPEIGPGARVVAHDGHGVVWSGPIALPEDSNDAVPEAFERALRAASAFHTAPEASVASRASTRAPTRPVQRARSHLERAAGGIGSSADPY